MPSYLVVGNQTLDSPDLAEAIRERVAKEPSTFHVVVPATPISRRPPHLGRGRGPRRGTGAADRDDEPTPRHRARGHR